MRQQSINHVSNSEIGFVRFTKRSEAESLNLKRLTRVFFGETRC